MRRRDPKTGGTGETVSPEARSGWSQRTPADLASLLLDLARALRGFSFYGETDPHRRPLLDRAYRALASELERAGALELELDASGFRITGFFDTAPATGVLGVLEEALRRHDLTSVQIDPSLTPTALGGLLDLLGQPGDRFDGPERFARALAARDSRGIRLNGLDLSEDTPTRKLSATSPLVSPSLAVPGATHAGSSGAGRRSVVDEDMASLDARPLEAPANDDRGERLRARLIELDCTVEDEAYRQRAAEISIWAEDLWSDGLRDECYRAMLVMADHAVGWGGRPEAQARAAAACFAELAGGPRLEDLIDRATGADGPGVRAAQLLLQLGEAAVPAILDRIASTPSGSDRIAPLHSLVLMLGDASLPALFEAIRGHDRERARIGIRLAGELQNPTALPVLIRALRAPDLSLRMETIRALSFMPGEESRKALGEALESDLEEIVQAASEAIASTGGSDAVPALLDVLEASLRNHRTNVCRSVVETLGQLGDERAVPRLSAILERKPMVRRAHWHSIQLAAVDAIAQLPSREARRCLERAARNAARPVRERAARLVAAAGEPA